MDNQVKDIFVDNSALFGFQGIKREDIVLLKLQGKQSPNGSIILLLIDSRNKSPVGLAKIPRNPDVFSHLEVECNSINKLQNIVKDSSVLMSIPGHCVMAEAGMRRIIVQSAFAGTPMVREFSSNNADKIQRLYSRILDWMSSFHEACYETINLDANLTEQYITEPVRLIKEGKPDLYQRLSKKAKNHFDSLPDIVKGRQCVLMHQHGDFNAYNLLIGDMDKDHFFVIDWEDYQQKALPIHDLNHFFITNANLIKGAGTVASVSALLGENSWYRDMYAGTVRMLADNYKFDQELFLALSPVYFMRMIDLVTSAVRQEEGTVSVWADLCNIYVESFC